MYKNRTKVMKQKIKKSVSNQKLPFVMPNLNEETSINFSKDSTNNKVDVIKT